MSDTLTKGDVKKLIKDTLGLENANKLDEAYVAQSKTFDIKTEKLTQQTIEGHKKLYSGYVENFNHASAELDTANRSAAASQGSEYRSLKMRETYNLNAIYLHELYFANIGDQNSTLYSDTLAYMRLDRDFGGVKNWQEDFIACGMSAREGWAVCCFNTFLKRYVNVIIDDHDRGIPLGCFPVIVVDMWAHSYYKDYTTDKGKYLRQMMSELDWNIIEERFNKSERILEAMK